ncbi:hypothetical protein PAMA_005548 [Pampus argenteus]
MASLKITLYLVCLYAWIITTSVEDSVPKAENVRWVSLDFKTTLTWTTTPSNYTYTVQFAGDDDDWRRILDCIQMSESECDLTNYLIPFNRMYLADILTVPAIVDNDYTDDPEAFPHTYSPQFNPYTESEISAVKFSVEVVEENKVTVNITDPLTGTHQHGKQLTIRDILKNDLKYKISYYKSGSTGKRDIISDSSIAEVSGLDAGQSYCFMVAAFIPSRPKTSQQGAWSTQQCTHGQELNHGALIGGLIILLIVLIVIITVTILCCRWCRQRNKALQTSQSSTVV